MSQQMQTQCDPFEVRTRMMRSGIKLKKLARRHRVSNATATRAFENRTPAQRDLLARFVHSLDVMDAKSMGKASEKLRSISNPYERKDAKVSTASQQN